MHTTEDSTFIDETEVAGWMGIDLDPYDAHLHYVIPAVNAYVGGLPSIDLNADGTWAPTTRLGAIMLAARIYRRKNSPGGIEAVGDTMTYVSRYDSDISRLLNIDTFRKPVIG